MADGKGFMQGPNGIVDAVLFMILGPIAAFLVIGGVWMIVELVQAIIAQ